MHLKKNSIAGLCRTCYSVVLNGGFLSLKNWWQEQANAAMWRSIEQCHVDVMGRFDRELGQCL